MIYVKQSISGKVNDKKQNLNGKLNYKEKERAEYLVQEKEVTPTIEQQEVTPDIGYNGLSKVTVDAIQTQEKSVIPTTDIQILEPDQGKFISKVTVDAIHTQQKSVKSTTSQQSIEPDKDYYISKITVDPVVYQEKTVTPTRETQTIAPDQNYDGLSQVTVGAIPSNLIDTTDANAVAINIRDGKSAYVNGVKVDGILPVLTYPVNPSSPSDFSYQFIAATAASKVVRNGTTYVMGSYQIATEQQPDSWMFEGNRKMKLGIPQNKVATAINLQSSQIKSGQTVLGVAGAKQGELSVTENGQYNVVNYDSVNVNVESGGGVLVLPNGIRFQNSTATEMNFLANADTSNATTMQNMFFGCSSLASINLSSFNTNNVTNMYGMFYSCYKLSSIDLSNFNTNNVTDMGYMFYSCIKLASLNLSKFNTSNVTTMNGMFYDCRAFTTLDLSKFNTEKVTDMGIMFGRCSSLTSLDLSSFNTNKLSNMNSMFYGCTNLVTLNVDSFVLSSFSGNNNGISACFKNCTSLSNDSLNSILKMLSTWTKSFSDKTLAKAGLTQEQAETCTTLSNWQACVNVGWSTGY